MTSDQKILKNSNSGASLSYFYRNNKKFVRKKMHDNDRSVRSLNMQREFESTEYISAVKIINMLKKHNQISCDMEFIDGYVSEDYAINMTFKNVDIFCDILRAYFENKVHNSVPKPLKNEVIKSKVNEIESNCNNINKNTKKLFISAKKKIFKSLRNTSLIYPQSSYHGDFTLSNLIFNKKDKHLYLIDFLDTYLDSYLIDYAKLLQDLEYCWSCRYSTQHVRLKGKILGERILKNIQFKDLRNYKQTFKIISLLNTLRILPYANDEITLLWVETTLKLQLR